MRVHIQKKPIWIGLVFLAVAAAVVIWWPHKTKVTADPYRPKAKEYSPTAAPTAENNIKNTASVSPTAKPIPTSTAAQQDTTGSIIITSPTQGETVTSGTKVSGTAKTSATRLYFRLKGGKSGQLASGVIAITANPAVAQPYSLELAFTNQAVAGDQGALEVYTQSAQGVESTIASVLVNLQ